MRRILSVEEIMKIPDRHQAYKEMFRRAANLSLLEEFGEMTEQYAKMYGIDVGTMGMYPNGERVIPPEDAMEIFEELEKMKEVEEV